MTDIKLKKRKNAFALTDLTGRPVSDLNRTEQEFERGIIAALDTGVQTKWQDHDDPLAEDSVEELKELCKTAGVKIIDTLIQKRPGPHRSLYLGKGKIEELALIVKETDADLVVFDTSLTPVQVKNLEKALEIKVLDRPELILDIFAARASTAVGKLQVELAQLNYLLPRLTKMWSHLAGQQGGAGMRGPGETQLETDRRHARKRISRLTGKLEEAEKRRELQREKRRRVPVPVISLVGYTNVGKSSLLNKITNADALAEDKLFATLDPLTRRIELKNNLPALLTDTVGFIRKLPHTLIKAFHATLEEVADSDLLLFVVDASDEKHQYQSRVVQNVLNQINAGKIPAVTVINKIDKITNQAEKERLKKIYPDSVFVSAVTGLGIDSLLEAIEFRLRDLVKPLNLVIPANRQDIISRIHKIGKIISSQWDHLGRANLVIEIPARFEHEFADFMVLN